MVEASVAERSAAARGSSVAVAHCRNLQVGGCPRWVGNRSANHGGRCMRQGAGESRRSMDGHRSGRLGGRSAVRWGLVVGACYSLVWQTMCVADVTTATAFARPGRCQRAPLLTSLCASTRMHTYLLWLSVCRQPVWVESFVVCHSVMCELWRENEGEVGWFCQQDVGG